MLEIQEVRDFNKCKNSMGYLKYNFAENEFAIFYGKKFLLKCLLLKGKFLIPYNFYNNLNYCFVLNFEAEEKNISENWMHEFLETIKNCKNSNYKVLLHRFLNKEFYYIDYLLKDQYESLIDLHRLNLKIKF